MATGAPKHEPETEQAAKVERKPALRPVESPNCLRWAAKVEKAKGPLDEAKMAHAAVFQTFEDDRDYHAKAFKTFLKERGMEATAYTEYRKKLDQYREEGGLNDIQALPLDSVA